MKKMVVLALVLLGVALFQFAPVFESLVSEPPPAVEEPLPEKPLSMSRGLSRIPGSTPWKREKRPVKP